MANILTLKRRINAAKNVSKTTRAMQMIAASKLKKAQDAVTSSRPYVSKISHIMTDLLEETKNSYSHPYLKTDSASDKTLLLVLSPDKGLCGSLITNLVKEFIKFQEATPDTEYIVVGKKLEGQIVHFTSEIVASFPFGTTLPKFDRVYSLIKIIEDYYGTGKVSSVKVLTAEYTSIFTQTPKIIPLLPIAPEDSGQEEKNSQDFYLFEPGKKELLDSLIKHYLEMTLYLQLIESYLSEQAARMMSMQNATNNANDIIDDLQLEYNKTRQAKITSEILDITGAQNYG
ncbi:MAG TPA: ATP synthase F1 subunit gamma [Xanthomonadales bacterium]|nr:ATP synthase F1 subunit gamma [Xanthomonadales bacterium]